MERSDSYAKIPSQHSWASWPHVGERDRDGDSGRSQGNARRRKGAGADLDRSAHAPAGDCRRVDVLPRRADEGQEVQVVPIANRSAADVLECRDDGEVPAGDARAVLQSVEVLYVSRAVGHQVSNLEAEVG